MMVLSLVLCFLSLPGYKFLPAQAPVAISPSGRWIALGRTGGGIAFHDSAGGLLAGWLDSVSASPSRELAFSPDGSTLASFHHNGHLVTWNLESWQGKDHGRVLDESGPHYVNYRFGAELSWSPKGDRILAADDAGNYSLSRDDGTHVHSGQVSGDSAEFQSAWHSNGHRLFLADGSRVLVLSVADGRLRNSYSPGDRITAMALRSATDCIITGHRGGRVRIGEMRSGRRIKELHFPNPLGWEDEYYGEDVYDVGALEVSPDQRFLAISTRDASYVYVYDFELKATVYRSAFLRAQFMEVFEIRWSAEGEFLFGAFEGGGGLLHAFGPIAPAPVALSQAVRVARRNVLDPSWMNECVLKERSPVPAFAEGIGIALLPDGSLAAWHPTGERLW